MGKPLFKKILVNGSELEPALEGSVTLSSSFIYDKNGNSKTATDFEGNAFSYDYDAVNRFLRKKQCDIILDENVYDVNGNLHEQYDANRNKTEFFYNNLRNVTSIKDAGGDITVYEPDFKGQNIKVYQPKFSTAKTVHTLYKYDFFGNVIEKLYLYRRFFSTIRRKTKSR